LATENAIKQVLAVLSANYPDHFNKLNAEQVRSLRLLYVQALADIDDETLRAAALRHISSSQWFPKVSELREAAVRVTRPPVPDALEAWGAVKAAFLSVGSYAIPHFDDPLTAAVVKQMGWRDLCLSEDGTADRARFVDAYERQAQRAHGQDVLPVGLQDGAMGYPLLPAGGAQEVIKRLAEAKRA
jgi:hypothetical protein